MTKNAQLEGLISSLRNGRLDFSDDPQKVRAEFDALLAQIPVAEDLSCDTLTLRDISVLRIRPPNARDDRALLYLHGGGYIAGSAQGYRGLAGELGRASAMTVWSVDYRLAPEHAFPAAVEDTANAYRGLLDSGIQASSIVFAGDSAGGGLAIAAMVALREAGIPLPAGALLISPWVDLACSGESLGSKADSDPSLTLQGLGASAQHYLGGASQALAATASLRSDLAGLPPILVQVGSSEILLDDALAMTRAAGMADVNATLRIWPGMPHVWHLFAFMLGDGRDAIKEAGEFLTQAIESNS